MLIKADKHLRYHLRFQVLPGKNLGRDARVLVKFCKEHGVEEVALFIAAEEWNNGLLSHQEEDRWFFAIKKIKHVLNAAGITVSLNPWTTVLGIDRGRRFPKGRRFRPMVSPLGETSKATASFADPHWREYIRNLYGRFSTLDFRVIWVEDDFRYHNHLPLTWGGGFEPAVLRRFSREIGRPVRRSQLVANLLKPGAPHPWRVLWMQTWREIQLEVAADIAQAIDKRAKGDTKIGLMSSHPSDHSIEGRNWQRLFEAFRVRGQVAHRPHYAGYHEPIGSTRNYSIMTLDLQRTFRPVACEVAPEVENAPFTHWTKSDGSTWAEMALCMFYGSDALLLDLFPFTGNRADAEPRIGRLLDQSRPALEWITQHFGKEMATRGVGLPWRQDAAAHIRTTEGRTMEELFVSPFAAGEFLLPYGIPISCSAQQDVNALFGNLAWALDESSMRTLLAGGLLLDGVAAYILCQRGFGEYIGVDCDRLVTREESAYSIETVLNKDCGIEPGFHFNHNLLDPVALLRLRRGAREWTTLATPAGERVGAALVTFQNKLGGRVVTFAAREPSHLPRSDHKQRIVRQAVTFAAGGHIPFATVAGGAHLLPMQFEEEGRRTIVIFNGSPDPAEPVIHWSGLRQKTVRATLLPPLRKPVALPISFPSHTTGLTIHCERPVPYQGFVIIELK